MNHRLTQPIPHKPSKTKRKLRDYSLVIIGFALLMLCLTFVNGVRGLTIFGSPFAGDFVGFYSAGQIANEYSFDRLYDLELQNHLVHQSLPNVPSGWTLPFVQPPFVALLFCPLARLPMWAAYLFWLIITCVLYLAALWFALKAYPTIANEVAVCVCLAFPPFLMVLAGGQLSALGCFILSVWMYLSKTNRQFAAGIVLGLLLYKPTMTILIIPALLFGWHFKTLLGFAVTATFLFALSLVLLGPSGMNHYISVLQQFSQSVARGEVFNSRYTDLNSFIRQLFHINLKFWGLVLALPIAFLMRQNPERAVVPTFLFSTYAPIYDVLMIVPVLIASHRILKPRWLALVFATTFITTPICQVTGFQLLTPVLMLITGVLIWNTSPVATNAPVP
ncbi:MAG TPA: glycosyltransferase family 87 protein [Pyrinomonadaceae bacterium]|jgi:Protein of unknown function (DUF2029).|nr:glycosyltransferase family 87 protein [Pyrinomonadaceae bacterium]